MTQIWISNRRTPLCFFGEVSNDRAKHVARELNSQGFKVKMWTV